MERRLLIVGIILILVAFTLYRIAIELDQEMSSPILEHRRTRIIFSNITYIVKARYKLVNNYKIPMNDYVYITLPRNTTYQHARLINITPSYVKIQKDEDGNIFAVLFLRTKPNEAVWIEAVFKITVHGYKVIFNVSESIWPEYEIVRRLTKRTSYWNTENPDLINLARRVSRGDNPLKIAISIAKWVKRHTRYSLQLHRLGAERALVRGILGDYIIQGDCTEVADVYVTLARIKGIPARTVFGLLLSRHKTKMWFNSSTAWVEGERLLEHWGGHMWSQVYLPPWGWIDVELLEAREAKIGDYSNFHVVFGVEETKYYGTTLSNFCSPGYLYLEYVEYDFEPVGN